MVLFCECVLLRGGLGPDATKHWHSLALFWVPSSTGVGGGKEGRGGGRVRGREGEKGRGMEEGMKGEKERKREEGRRERRKEKWEEDNCSSP